MATIRLCVGSGVIRQCLKHPRMEVSFSAAGPKGSHLVRACLKTSSSCPSLVGSLKSVAHWVSEKVFLFDWVLFYLFVFIAGVKVMKKQKNLTAHKRGGAALPFRAFLLDLVPIARQPTTGLEQKTEEKCLLFAHSTSECRVKSFLGKTDSTFFPT